MLLLVPFSACMGEGVSDHAVMTSLVYGNYLAAGTMYFMINNFNMILFTNSIFVAPYYMTMSEFFIFPQLFPAGGTVYCEHYEYK